MVTASKRATPKSNLQIWGSSEALISQLAIVTIFDAGVQWSITCKDTPSF